MNQLAPDPSHEAAVVGAFPRYIAAGPAWYKVLSNLNPIVEPAGIGIVSEAGLGFALQVISPDVTEVTGELLLGRRTAPVEVWFPAMRVDHMSISVRDRPNRMKEQIKILTDTK